MKTDGVNNVFEGANGVELKEMGERKKMKENKEELKRDRGVTFVIPQDGKFEGKNEFSSESSISMEEEIEPLKFLPQSDVIEGIPMGQDNKGSVQEKILGLDNETRIEIGRISVESDRRKSVGRKVLFGLVLLIAILNVPIFWYVYNNSQNIQIVLVLGLTNFVWICFLCFLLFIFRWIDRAYD